MTNPSDHDILMRMYEMGGSFASALANAGFHADADNLARIKTAWPELWEKCRQVATIKPMTKAEMIEETASRR